MCCVNTPAPPSPLLSGDKCPNWLLVPGQKVTPEFQPVHAGSVARCVWCGDGMPTVTDLLNALLKPTYVWRMAGARQRMKGAQLTQSRAEDRILLLVEEFCRRRRGKRWPH